MRQTAVIEWLAGECVTVLANAPSLSLSNPSQHVDLADDRDEHPYPFVGLRKISATTRSAGIGNGDLYVERIEVTDGLVSDIIYGRDNTLRVDVLPITDGDRRLRERLSDALTDRLSLAARGVTLIPADMEPPEVEDMTTAGRPDDFVYGDGLSVAVEYTTEIVHDDVTTAETVNRDIDVGDDADDVEGADAYDVSVTGQY